MAELVAVRHKSQGDETESGLMSAEYLERFGKDLGWVPVKDQSAAQAASEPADPAAAPEPNKPKGR